MVRILLICAAGMSTSLLVERMRKAAEDRNLEAEIQASTVANFDSLYNKFDVILLGPQVRYRWAALAPKAEAAGIPFEVINPVDYGTVNGEKVLDFALKLLAEKEK